MSRRRRHPGAPIVHFTRGIEWHNWVARTDLAKITLTRRPRPKGTPQWGRWVFDLRVDFTDGTVHEEAAVATTARGAKRAARDVLDAHWEAARMPRPRPDHPHRIDPVELPKYPPREVPRPRRPYGEDLDW